MIVGRLLDKLGSILCRFFGHRWIPRQDLWRSEYVVVFYPAQCRWCGLEEMHGLRDGCQNGDVSVEQGRARV
jgi:hypothetical protein